MRNLFPELTRPDAKEFKQLWTNAVFVFDTSVLLSLYGIPKQARDKMISVLKELQRLDRIWIPHHVAVEFYRRRFDVIYDQEKSHAEAIKSLDDTERFISKMFDSKEILSKISGSCKIIRNEIKKHKKRDCDWLKKDKIEIDLDGIFKNKVGPCFEDERLKEICENGKGRYDNKVPPGYKDADKDKSDKTGIRMFGDLIIWHQIIEHAKMEKKSLIFVTDDQKEDWWWKINSNTIGPRYELRKEIKEIAQVEFYMYKSEQFMKHAGEYLSVKFDTKLIERVKKSKEVLAKSQDDLSVSSDDNFELSSTLSFFSDSFGRNFSASKDDNLSFLKETDDSGDEVSKKTTL